MGRGVFFGWFVVAATFTVLLLGFGVVYSFASFFDGLEADFQASRGDVSLIFSIAGFLYFSLGAISGPLSDRIGARPVVAFGIVLIALGLLASSFAQNLWQIYLSYGAAVGVGIGFAYVPSVGVLQRWFVRRRGFATGLAVAGIGVGTLVLPPVSSALVEALGWRGTFQVLAGVVLVVGLLAAALLVPKPRRARPVPRWRCDGGGAGGRPVGDVPSCGPVNGSFLVVVCRFGDCLPWPVRAVRASG